MIKTNDRTLKKKQRRFTETVRLLIVPSPGRFKHTSVLLHYVNELIRILSKHATRGAYSTGC